MAKKNPDHDDPEFDDATTEPNLETAGNTVEPSSNDETTDSLQQSLEEVRDRDINKTKSFGKGDLTVEADSDFESIDELDSMDQPAAAEKVPSAETKAEIQPGQQTLVLHDSVQDDIDEDIELGADIDEDLELGGDIDEELELGADVDEDSELGDDELSGKSKLVQPILPKTVIVEERRLLSSELDESLGSSLEFSDSMANLLGSSRREWGKQNSDATPMSSLEAPTRSQRPVARPKLNDRLVVADGEREVDGNPDYRIVSFLGAGAMGEVYVARQTSVDRDVAFKKQIFKAETSRRKMIRNRNKFLFEAQITANLDHPNIVAIHDMGRDQSGDVFYCMELVRGQPWDEVIDEMSLEDNLEVLLKVINGIAYAHSKNTIHRDLKPENTMLGSFGEVLIMDWGLGVNLDQGPPASMGGTPGFMAPEMAKPPKEAVGKHSDIYLLGAILFMITTGQSPHQGDDVWECLRNASSNRIVDVSNSERKIDKRLLAIAVKAMSTEPADRYANADQLRRAIENYQSNLQSIKLTERSELELALAMENQNYEYFSKSMFGFREALSLWEKNANASSGLQRARLAYAESALDRQDFELGMSLLDPNQPDEAPLFEKLRKEAASSEQRRRLVWLAIGASVLLLGTLVFTSTMNARTQKLNAENLALAVKLEKKAKLEAVSATQVAEKEKQRAENERGKAEVQRKKAEEAKKVAEDLAIAEEAERRRAEGFAKREKEAREKADELRLKEFAARRAAELAKDEKETERQKAEAERLKAEAERQKAFNLAGQLRVSEKSARQRLFQSNIGLIDGYIRDNQIEQAIETLERTRRNDSRFVNWEWNRLYHLCHTEVKSESLDEVTDIDQSSDGTVSIVSASGKAKFWNPNNKAVASEIQISTAKAIATALSRNGKWAAIGTADPKRKLTIWDTSSGEMVANLSDNIDASLVCCVSFNDSGTQLAAGDSARIITLFGGDGSNWSKSKKLGFHSSRPVDLDFAPGGRKLASVSKDGLSIVWDTQSGKPISAYSHPAQMNAVKFVPGQKGLVACATDEREIVLWNSALSNSPTAWQELSAADLKVAKSRAFVESLVVHESVVNDLDFSKDGETMVTCGDDRTIAVWDFGERTLVKRFRGHVNAVLACCIGEEGKAAVSASADGDVRAWRFDEYEDQRAFIADESMSLNCVAFNSDATQLLTGDEAGVLRIWNKRQGAETESKLEFDPKLGRKAAYLPKSERIVTSSPGNVFVWQNGKLLHKKTEVGQTGIVVVTKNERTMITGGDEENPTIVWDLETGKKVATLLEGSSRNRVTAMAVSPDDQFVAMGTGSVEGIVSVFDLRTFQLVDEFEEHRGWITDLVFSPASNEFLSADSVEGYVNAWVVEGNRVRRQKKIDGIGGSYIRIAYSESGKQFVTSTNTDTSKSEMQIWDSRTKSPVSKVQLARTIDFVSVIKDEVVFRLTNGKAYGWKHASGPRQMRNVPMFSNASYPTALNGWSKLPGNKSLVYGDGFVKILGAEPTANRPKQRTQSIANVFDSAGNPGPCVSALFADGEKQVVALYRDGAVRFWDRKSNAVKNVIQSPESKVTGIDVSSKDSRRLATCDSVGVIRCIDVPTNEVLSEIDTGSKLTSVKWNGKDNVIVSGQGELLLVDLDTEETVSLNGTADDLLAIDSSDSGDVIVGVGLNRKDEGRVYLWQKSKGVWQERPNVFGSQVLSVRVSPDGKRAFTGDAAGAITVWYIPDPGVSDPPRKLISLIDHEKDVSSIAISSDGSEVASASKDGSAILWLSAEPRE